MSELHDGRSRLAALLAAPEIDLVQAALAVAADEYPGLDDADLLGHLDALAAEVREILPATERLEPRLAALTHVLGGVHGFQGNARDYGDPRNSYLNEVLARKVGIPISLGLLYQAVGRRAGIALHGIAFPGHFLVGATLGEQRVVLDPFHRGARLHHEDLRALLGKTAPGMTFTPQMLRPATRKQIVYRMLSNLKNLHLAAQDWPRALATVELLLVVAPAHPGELRVRASVLQSLGAFDAALLDVQHCLALSPDAPDATVLRFTAQALASRAGWRS
jgi:regulator of sirC expression with transglutaminase-like and TPR domain